MGVNIKKKEIVFRVLRNPQKLHLSDDSIREMLELDLDESDISGVSDDSNIDENWEPGNSLLEGKVEDNKDDQETAVDHHQAFLKHLVPSEALRNAWWWSPAVS